MGGAEVSASPRVTGVVLAAGRSTRFGSEHPKQLHKIDGQTLVYRTARSALASKLCQTIVVIGHRGDAVGAAVAGLAVEVIDNPDFADGQSASVKAGLSRLDPDSTAAMFLPCDLPNLDAQTIDRMIEAYAECLAPIVVPVVDGKRRAPVIIDRSLFPAVLTIAGDQGARQLFRGYENDIVEVAFSSVRPFEDLDRSG